MNSLVSKETINKLKELERGVLHLEIVDVSLWIPGDEFTTWRIWCTVNDRGVSLDFHFDLDVEEKK